MTEQLDAPLCRDWQAIIPDVKLPYSRVDLWCKYYHAQTDTFLYRRMPDCWQYTISGVSAWGCDAYGGNLPDHLRPTHFMMIPEGPVT